MQQKKIFENTELLKEFKEIPYISKLDLTKK